MSALHACEDALASQRAPAAPGPALQPVKALRRGRWHCGPHLEYDCVVMGLRLMAHPDLLTCQSLFFGMNRKWGLNFHSPNLIILSLQ